MVPTAQKTSNLLSQIGISCTVINARFLRPLDQALIHPLARRIGRVVTLEEGALPGGFGSAVLSYLNSRNYTGKVQRLGIPDEFVDHGERRSLLSDLGLTSRKISETISKIAELNSVF